MGSPPPQTRRQKTLAAKAGRAAISAVLLLAGAAAAFSAAAPQRVAAAIATGDCTPNSAWPANDAGDASQVMSLINQHRAGLGEGQLVTSPTLTASAIWKARHMAQFNYFGHDDPGPPTTTTPARAWSDRLQTCGYPYSAGENIAEGFPDAQSVVTAWLNSPGHKANIENASYVATGLGVAEGTNGEIYWVQDFGTVADSGSPPPPPPTTTSAPPTTTSAPPPPPTTTQTTTTNRTTTTDTTTTSGGGATTPATTTSGAPSRAGGSGSAAAPLRLADAEVRIGTRRLVLATQVTQGGKAPAKAAVKCVARIGSRDLRVVVNAYRGDLARCTWRLPAHVARGAVAHGFVAVKHGSVRARGTFSLILRPA